SRLARPQGRGRGEQRDESRKQLALRELVAMKNDTPQARRVRGRYVRPEIRAEHRPVVVGPAKSVLPADGHVRPTHSADAEKDDRRSGREPPERAKASRGRHRRRRELVDDDERGGEGEVVDEVAVRERLNRERTGKDRERDE